MTRAPLARHYGMDWLRVGAFALLILYHIAMVFVPWPFHAKSTHSLAWVRVPMLATNAWRLPLLFVVSGYASRALLARRPGPAGFAINRTWRLLVPLAFGVAVIVPPQTWIELVTQHRYTGAFLPFWVRDYFRFRIMAGVPMPAWNHLWFVGYLWAYTLVLAAGVAAVRAVGGGARVQAEFDGVFGGWGGLIVPMAWFAAIHGWWFVMAGETHGLVDDWVAHISYLPAFLFGFGLARSDATMAMAVRVRWLAAAMAVGGYVAVLGFEFGWIGGFPTPRWVYRPYGIAHAVQEWSAILALIGFAERHWNRDHRWRPMLTEAVFPFYIVHQTIIVVVTYALRSAGLSAGAEFAILFGSTVLGCWAFYLSGRAVPVLRPLIGLRPRRRPLAPALI